MATVKKTSGNYLIQTPRVVDSNITLDSDTVYVTGNLIIRGNTQTITSNNTSIIDNIITLNYGETGNGVSMMGNISGIRIDRGNAIHPMGNVDLRWNETNKVWEISVISGNTISYQNISTTIGGAALTAIVQDTNPYLGANLNTNGYSLKANVGTNIIFESNIQLINSGVPSLAQPNSTILYAGTIGGGTSGLYVLNSTAANKELITKTRSFGFSLIL